jgi:hypothetical protein
MLQRFATETGEVEQTDQTGAGRPLPGFQRQAAVPMIFVKWRAN